jgi:hypothetical protein
MADRPYPWWRIRHGSNVRATLWDELMAFQDAQNGDRDLTSPVTCFTSSGNLPTADGWWQFLVQIGDGSKDLDSAGSTLSFKLVVDDQTVEGIINKAKPAEDSEYRTTVFKSYIAVDDVVTLTVQSSNSNDTDVDVTVTPIRVLDTVQQCAQTVAKILYRTDGNIYFVTQNGNDSHDGLTPSTAKASPKTVIEAMSDYDVTVIGQGVFALGNNVITQPDDTIVDGCGKKATQITSTAVLGTKGPILNPGNRTITKRLAIVGLLDNGDYQACYGAHQDASGFQSFEDAELVDAYLSADTDGIYIRNSDDDTSFSLVADRVCVHTKYDCVAAFGDSDYPDKIVVEVRDSILRAKGPSASDDQINRGAVADSSVIRLRDTTIYAGGDVGYALGLYASDSGSITMDGGSIELVADEGGSNYICYQLTSGTVTLKDVAYDVSQVWHEYVPTTISSVVDVGKVSGDETAADNLEAMLDGTGAVMTLSQLRITGENDDAVVYIDNLASAPAVKIVGNDAAASGVWIEGGTDAIILKSTWSGAGIRIDANDGISMTVDSEDDAIYINNNPRYLPASIDSGATALFRDGGGGKTADDLSDEIATVDGNVDSILTDTGTTLPASIAGITGALNGEGSYTGTLTVDDGEGNGLEGAVVHARRGGVLKASGTTNADGEITDWVFGAYTYDLAVRLAGYQPDTDTITVSGNAWTKTVSLTAISITAPDAASLCTVQFRVKLADTAVSGAVCKAKLIGVNQASDGVILSNAESSDTTDSEGVAELQLVQKGSVVKGNGIYKIWVEIAGNPVASVETAIPNQSTILFEDLLR